MMRDTKLVLWSFAGNLPAWFWRWVPVLFLSGVLLGTVFLLRAAVEPVAEVAALPPRTAVEAQTVTETVTATPEQPTAALGAVTAVTVTAPPVTETSFSKVIQTAPARVETKTVVRTAPRETVTRTVEETVTVTAEPEKEVVRATHNERQDE